MGLSLCRSCVSSGGTDRVAMVDPAEEQGHEIDTAAYRGEAAEELVMTPRASSAFAAEIFMPGAPQDESSSALPGSYSRLSDDSPTDSGKHKQSSESLRFLSNDHLGGKSSMESLQCLPSASEIDCHRGEEASAVDLCVKAGQRPRSCTCSVPFNRETTTRSTTVTKLPSYMDPHHGLRADTSVVGSQSPINHVYIMQDKLGDGAFGVVWKVKHRESGKVFAVKSIHISSVASREVFLKELAIARRFNHPYVVRLSQFFEGQDTFHLIMELCTGGDLVDRLNEELSKNGTTVRGGFRAHQVARYAWQMLNAITYMHHYKFAHRDIKPENFMLASSAMGAALKLIDFGLARAFESGQKMYSKVGSKTYMAPEVSEGNNGYNMLCDIWSTGVTVHCLAAGLAPMWDNVSATAAEEGRLSIHPGAWGDHPDELLALTRELLTRDPRKRPHAKAVLESDEWLCKHGKQSTGSSKGCCGFLSDQRKRNFGGNPSSE